MIKTVGQFTYDPATGALTGPKAYMESADYRRCIERLEAGQNVVFNFGAGRPGADVVTAMLVAIQTDFAGWRGRESFLATLESAP